MAKDKTNISFGVTPMYELVMKDTALDLVGRMCVISDKGITNDETEVPAIYAGPVTINNDSHERHWSNLPIGLVGLCMGVAHPSTILKMLVIENQFQLKQGIYHVQLRNLEAISDPPIPHHHGQSPHAESISDPELPLDQTL